MPFRNWFRFFYNGLLFHLLLIAPLFGQSDALTHLVQASDALTLEQYEQALLHINATDPKQLSPSNQTAYHLLSALTHRALHHPDLSQAQLESAAHCAQSSDQRAAIAYASNEYKNALEQAESPEIRQLCQTAWIRNGGLEADMISEKLTPLIESEPLQAKQRLLATVKTLSLGNCDESARSQTEPEILLSQAWTKLQQAQSIPLEERRPVIEQARQKLQPLAHGDYATEAQLCLALTDRLDSPEALFKTQPLSAYLQGDPASLKLLRLLVKEYPLAPIALDARYLLAQDKRLARFDPKTQKFRARTLPDAIEWYRQLETSYLELNSQNRIPTALQSYYAHLYLQAKLERAECNLEVAKESDGWKQKLTLDFAEEELKSLIQENSIAEVAFNARLLLAQVYQLKEQSDIAEHLLTELGPQKNNPSHNSLAWFQYHYQLGLIKLGQGDLEQALAYLSEAEKFLPEQPNAIGTKLDLWLKQGVCYRLINQTDAAMRLFSRIINRSETNPQQAEALYHRALLFWETGQAALAIKQMERLFQHSEDNWKSKAAQHLEIFYGSTH